MNEKTDINHDIVLGPTATSDPTRLRLSSSSSSSSTSSLYVLRSFFRPSFRNQTRKRRPLNSIYNDNYNYGIVKHVQERYLRQDLAFGFHYNNKNHKNDDDDSPTLIATLPDLLQLILTLPPPQKQNVVELVVVDTNVLLHNLDLLEQSRRWLPCLNMVICQTALLETRKHSPVAYDRVVALLLWQHQQQSQPPSQEKTLPHQQHPHGVTIFFPDVFHADTFINEHQHVGDEASTVSVVSANDWNDLRIRRVAEFFSHHVSFASSEKNNGMRVVYLSDDAASRKQLIQQQQPNHNNLVAQSVREWVASLEQQYPTLTLRDYIASSSHFPLTPTTPQPQPQPQHPGIPSTEQPFFEPHPDVSVLLQGIQKGTLHRGFLRCSATDPYYYDDDNHDADQHNDSSVAYVTLRHGEERVAITIAGMKHRNRAVDGDVVAVALNPVSEWMGRGSSKGSHSRPDTPTPPPTAAGIGNDTAAPTLYEMENVNDRLPAPVDIDTHNDQKVSLLRPTGRVVGILRRNFPTALSGSIVSSCISESSPEQTQQHQRARRMVALCEHEHVEDDSRTLVFFPVDVKKHPPVLIRSTQPRAHFVHQRILVAMDAWPAQSPFPLGHYVRTLGDTGSKDVETQVLLEQFEIPYEPFSAAVLACLPPIHHHDPDTIIKITPERTDLRHVPVLSIDPPSCKDIDDALHCTALPNGNMQIGVHIADVTHFVKEGSAIDMEAANRCTSTYLVNQRLDMLPSLLTTDLCSLKCNVDRLAFSVLWEVTPQADIVNVDFCKSIIHSIAALTYQQAQAMIEQPDDINDIQACSVKRLAGIARLLRSRRVKAGALTLASPEVKFVLDSESLNPTDVQAYALLEANALVEEFMLLANVTVSKKILRHYPTLSVLRRHPSPNRAMFDDLISKTKCRGFVLDIEDSKRLADSLDAAVDPSDPYVNKLVRILSTRCMSPAQYFCSGDVKPHEWHHYGLAAPVYTHFTSPIRRYADVCVHRLLAAALGVAPLPVHFTKFHLHDLCATMNRRQRYAQLAGRASVQLHTLLFFAGEHGAREEDAYVLNVSCTRKDLSLTVMVPRYGIEGTIRLSMEMNMDDPDLMFSPEQHMISYRQDQGQERVRIQVFDKVRVRIWVRESDDRQRELTMDLVSPVWMKSQSFVESANPKEDNHKKKNPRSSSATTLIDEDDKSALSNSRKKQKIDSAMTTSES